MTMPDFSSCPVWLARHLTRHWERLDERLVEAGLVLPERLRAELPGVWAGSDYVAERMIRQPRLVLWLVEPGVLEGPLEEASLRQAVRARLAAAEDETAFLATLRQLRHEHMVRIIWRDLTGLGDYHSTVADLSLLADVITDEALQVLYRQACARDGMPLDMHGRPVQLVVFAMGKLGARELNLSSDIDLIFGYEHEGEFADHPRGLTYHQFFQRLGQQLIRALDFNTGDGFAFRVDMRLRPWGGAGALAVGFDAMESYYERQGREWERYALIKIRPVAGDLAAGRRMVARLRPFVYRRYIDYGAFESLREMKGLIEREVRRQGIEHDVKLGSGGIREIEFIVQAFQLIRGGQLPALQVPNLLQALPRLAEADLLPEAASRELARIYVFLRNVEHRLQALEDRQTQRLPTDDEHWERLALAMGYADRRLFERVLGDCREVVRTHFRDVIAHPGDEEENTDDGNPELLALWRGRMAPDQAELLLRDLGIDEPGEILVQLQRFRDSRPVLTMQKIGRDRLDRLMPRLLESLGYQHGDGTTLARLINFLESVLRRSAYIALLVENPSALTQLVKLSAASFWIADQLARHPVLLDELLDVNTLYSPPETQVLEDELHQLLLRVPEDDLEQQMEVLRHFKQAHLLRVAASEVSERLPLMKVSDYLTWLAEAILHQVVQVAWRSLVDRHGRPWRSDGEPCAPDFIVVGYGKLGGIELGYGSDLDLVFLHDADPEGVTDGDRPLANEQFFARLGQRIIHILNTRTMSGELYEVDVRLRPSGASGLLVSSLPAFQKYQLEQAWIWEHQALVRARVVAGCPRTGRRFEEIRQSILVMERDPAHLRQEVLTMRDRMVRHLGHGASTDRFDLKQDPGGIVDIEFMVQYGVLRWAAQHRELTRWTDNVRLLETLAVLHLMPAQDAGLLREAYLAYRAAAHRLALRNEPSEVDAAEFAELREGVRAIWENWFLGGEPLPPPAP